MVKQDRDDGQGKNDDDNDDHCDLEYLRIIKEVHVDEYENDG